jgi:hypothetical protein
MNIESFEQACQIKGYDPVAILPDVSNVPARYKKSIIATFMLSVICEASRTKDPNWNDRSERKWLPWFDMEVDKNNPSGFRLDAAYFDGTLTLSPGGSRLCYESEKEAEYHANQHIQLYRDMMVIE